MFKKKISIKKETIKVFSYRYASSLTGNKKDLQNITIGQFLNNYSQQNPYKDWLRYCPSKDLKWTYDEFNKIINTFAEGFLDSRGRDVFTSILENDTDNLITQFACARANIKYAFLPPNTEKELIKKTLQETNSRALIVNEKHRDRNNFKMVEEIVPHLNEWPFGVPLKVKEYPNLKLIIQTAHEFRKGFVSLRDLKIKNGVRDPLPSIQKQILPTSVASVFYGNEGKGIAFSHSSLVNNSLYFADAVGLGWEDRVLVDLPFWKSFGQTAGLLSPYSSLSLVVIASPVFNEEKTLKKIFEEKINTLFLTPSQALLLTQHPLFSSFKKDSLKKIVLVGSCNDKLNGEELVKLKNSFPSVENFFFSFSLDHFAGVSFLGKLNTNDKVVSPGDSSAPAGHLLPNLEAKIVDSSGKSVPHGTKGNLLLKGHNLFSGFLVSQSLQSPTLDSQGFFNTGSSASVDSNGFFSIY